MHPSDAIRGRSSGLLEGKRIVLGVSGSIAAVKTVELARALIRHGARVTPVMTDAATRLIHPDALEFATGEKPVIRLTGQVEHVRDQEADLLVVAPATGNTLSKLALGIDDSPVTTYFTARPRDLPTIVAPAMHEHMWESAFLRENLTRLRNAGVTVLDPFFEENEAKLPSPEVIAEHAIRALGPGTLRGKRVLVVNGSTLEALDEMRVITNRSTGRTGAALAVEAFRLGADVEHWFGHGHVHHFPDWIPTRRFVTVHDLLTLAPDAAGFDAVLMPAAVSDFGPAPAEGKISSDTGGVTLRLQPLPKVVKAIREHFKGTLVGFKAESGVDEKTLVERARRGLAASGAAFVVANNLREVAVDETRVFLVDDRDVKPVTGTKDEVARGILARLAEALA